ncbi:hypothetical protein [Parvibaculum sp.]|uniref:hypothetical protein n=1 Tax=Parvibaculum sp. TaxID=2024848 RepID=UPI0027319C98|nr:hypothetical protein [Parvibaculum sp.]MDP1627748.1 hypothetical protein [Parvibaculum sp.]MDP2150746.1 hypothetical protein [Parvibaculum sp.]MDP3327981.1 hypothetical protein [Parvibaculum sp.]
MNGVGSTNSAAAKHDGKRTGTSLDLAGWLGLAAAPAFAIMALVTALLDGGPMEAICSTEHGHPLSGMVPMYLLMCIFHSTPWLRLGSGGAGRRN